MKITLTGGSGKLGQYVARELVASTNGRTPHQVTVLDRIMGPEIPGVRYVMGDITNLGNVVGVVAGADAVIHLAAIARSGIASNEDTFRVNVMGTFNVHEAAWRLGVRRVVSTSSTAATGWDYWERMFTPQYLPIDEEHPLRPQDPYGLSKQVTEVIARSYTERCGMETVVLRPPGIMSPEQMDGFRATRGRTPAEFHLFCYVDIRDLAEAYRLAVERPIEGNVVLWVAADDSIVDEPMADVVPRLAPEIGDLAHDITGSTPLITNARAKDVLGWQPRRSWRRPDEDA